MSDAMVTPVYEREDGSAPGPFYVIKNQCITCSLPTETAPENIRYHERACTSCPTSLTDHCVVIRQPETADELDCMIDVVRRSCVEAYCYCGTDPEILRRLVEAGCREQCDALVQGRRDDPLAIIAFVLAIFTMVVPVEADILTAALTYRRFILASILGVLFFAAVFT